MKKPTIITLSLIIVLVAIISLSLNRLFPEQQIVKQFFQEASPSKAPTLVAGFPEVPVYPQAKLISSSKEGAEEDPSYMGTWVVSASVPDIVKWYITSLENSGWLIDVLPANLEAEDVQYLVAKKAEVVLQLSVIRNQEEENTQIILDFPAKALFVEDKEST